MSVSRNEFFACFISGGLAVTQSYGIISVALKYFGIAFGFNGLIIPFDGLGGTERWIVYPVMLWLAGLGGYMMTYNTTK